MRAAVVPSINGFAVVETLEESVNMPMNKQPPVRPASLSLTAARVFLACGALVCLALAGPAGAADKAPVAKPTPDREELTISTEEMTRPWSGDLDGMIDRRTIRFLTVYSKTFYFIDKGVHRGTAYDMGRLFVDDLNK